MTTKQQRGSAMLVGAPYRPWLSVPAGESTPANRMALLHYAAREAAEAPHESGRTHPSLSVGVGL